MKVFLIIIGISIYFKLGNLSIPWNNKVIFSSSYPLVVFPHTPDGKILELMLEKSEKQCHIFSHTKTKIFISEPEFNLNIF